MLFTLLDLFVLSFSCRMMKKNGRSRKKDLLVRHKKSNIIIIVGTAKSSCNCH